MPETALCNSCVWSGSNKGKAQGAAGFAPDWDGEPQMKECTGNDELICIVCGKPDEDLETILKRARKGESK